MKRANLGQVELVDEQGRAEDTALQRPHAKARVKELPESISGPRCRTEGVRLRERAARLSRLQHQLGGD